MDTDIENASGMHFCITVIMFLGHFLILALHDPFSGGATRTWQRNLSSTGKLLETTFPWCTNEGKTPVDHLASLSPSQTFDGAVT